MFYEFFQANTLSPALISADSFMVVVNNGSCTENGALQRDKHFGNVLFSLKSATARLTAKLTFPIIGASTSSGFAFSPLLLHLFDDLGKLKQLRTLFINYQYR